MSEPKRGRPPRAREEHDVIDRELAIIEQVEKHPDWNKNDYKRYFENQGIMAAETFNRTIEKMLKGGTILKIKKQGRPKNRDYFLVAPKGPVVANEKEFRNAMDYSLYIWNKLLDNLVATYQQQSRVDKILSASGLVEELFRNLNGLTIFQILSIHSSETCNEYKEKITVLIARLIDAARKDTDDPLVYRLMMTRVLPITSASIQTMKEARVVT